MYSHLGEIWFQFLCLIRLDIILLSVIKELIFLILEVLVVMFYLFVCSPSILEYTISPRFPCDRSYGDDGQGSCLPFATAIRVLLIIASGSALILGWVNSYYLLVWKFWLWLTLNSTRFVILALFLLRCVLVYKLRPSSWVQARDGRWSFPTGVLTFEVSIKFLRPHERVERDSEAWWFLLIYI